MKPCQTRTRVDLKDGVDQAGYQACALLRMGSHSFLHGVVYSLRFLISDFCVLARVVVSMRAGLAETVALQEPMVPFRQGSMANRNCTLFGQLYPRESKTVKEAE